MYVFLNENIYLYSIVVCKPTMIISVRLCHPFVSESSEQTTISHTVTHDTIAFTYHIRERDGVLFANRLAFNMVLFFWFLGWSWLFDCSTPHIYDAYEIFFNHHPISTIHQHIIRQCRGVYARLSVVFSLSLSLLRLAYRFALDRCHVSA